MSTGALAPVPLQWFDNAGAVLAGGSITTYLTGTTTATPTWSAIAMGSGNLHANPVVLDSAGRATIFILRGLGYRFVVKDSSGVTVETIDGILAYDDTYTHTANVEVPIGGVIPYCGTSAPSRYLLCDGTSYLRADYAALFGVCSTRWGAADSTHFNVPDMRGFYPFGQSPAAVSTPADPTLATDQSGTDLAAGNYKVAIVGVGPNGAVSLPSSSVTQAVGAGGAGRIVVTYVLPTGATKVRVYVTTLAGATCDRYFEATASPYNFVTLTGATVAALPTAATTTGATLGASFGTLDHAHLGASHTHATAGATASGGTAAPTGATAAGGTGAVTGSTASGTADIGLNTEAVTSTGGTTAVVGVTDSGHTHAATGLLGPSHTHDVGTLAGGAHTHDYGTLSATAEGVRSSAAANPPGVAFNFIVRAL